MSKADALLIFLTQLFAEKRRFAGGTSLRRTPLAKKLYERYGFRATGVEDEDEMEMAFMPDEK